MGKMLQYTENNRVLMALLFVAIVAVIVLWNFYLKEKRRVDKIEGTVLGERRFYRAFAGEGGGPERLLEMPLYELRCGKGHSGKPVKKGCADELWL